MKRFFKFSGIIIGVLAVALLVVYFYVINNAETLVRDFVSSQSHGKLSVEIKRIKFNPRKLHLPIIEPHFYSNDTLDLPTGYDIKANSFALELSSLNPLLFEKKMFLNTLVCMRPPITIAKWKDQPKEKFLLQEQMGKAYERLNTVLITLNIKYCLIDSGSFTLANKVIKDAQRITITDYYLRIDNLKIDSSSGLDHRYLFTDRIKFYASHQNIVFDNGNQGIKYSYLRINSLNQSIEIDSCFIYGKKVGNYYNEFGVFFDTLRLTNADFNKLTQQSLIKADSAICINPDIKIKMQLPAKQKAGKVKRITLSRDSMDLAVKMLLGDLDDKYVGVLNATLSMQTKVDNQITSYSTKKNNFIMQDIMVIKDPRVPFKVGSFFVAVE